VRYDMGTRQTEGQSGNHAVPQRPIPMGVWSITFPRLQQTQNVQPRTTLNHGSTYPPQTKPSVPKPPGQRPGTSRTRTTEMWPVPSTAPKQTQVVCYGCENLATSGPNAHCIGATHVPQQHVWTR